MEYNLLFYDTGCNHCRDLKEYLDKRDAKSVKQTIKFVGPKYHKEFGVERVPTLILAQSQQKLVGDEVFAWLRQELTVNNVDPDSVMSELPTGYWEGNLKFAAAVFLLAGAVKYC